MVVAATRWGRERVWDFAELVVDQVAGAQAKQDELVGEAMTAAKELDLMWAPRRTLPAHPANP